MRKCRTVSFPHVKVKNSGDVLSDRQHMQHLFLALSTAIDRAVLWQQYAAAINCANQVHAMIESEIVVLCVPAVCREEPARKWPVKSFYVLEKFKMI